MLKATELLFLVPWLENSIFQNDVCFKSIDLDYNCDRL